MAERHTLLADIPALHTTVFSFAIEFVDRRGAWLRTEVLACNDCAELLLDRHCFNESGVALLFECTLQCVRQTIDTAKMARDATFQHWLRLTAYRVTKGESRVSQSFPTDWQLLQFHGCASDVQL